VWENDGFLREVCRGEGNDGAIHSYRNRNGSEWTGPRLVEEEKMSLILGDASLT